MPPQVAKANPILGAVRASAKKKVDYGADFSSLPGGIQNGIAELTRCEVATYKKGDNAGKRYFMAMGTVLRPLVAVDTVKRFHNGKVEIVSQQEVEVKGRHTKIGPMPMCQTQTKGNPPKVTTVEEHVDLVLNELKKLGGEECTHSLADLPDNATEAQCFDAIAAICQALQDAKPPIRFKFRTWGGEPSAAYPGNPRINEYWQGAVSGEEVSVSSGAAVQDESGAGDSDNGQVHESADQQPEPDAVENVAEVELFLRSYVMPKLVGEAESGDKAAKKRLTDMALEAGVSKEDIENADNWQAVADLIDQATAPAEEVQEEEVVEEEVAWVPAVDEEYEYAPNVKNKAGKIVKGKPVKCIVSAVDEGKQTVTLKAGKVEYKNVKWDVIAPQ